MDEKLRSGPIEAPADFEVAFREHFAPVYRFIARRVGTDLAEDLAAEAFATAYRRRASYDQDRGSLRSWLFGIAANLVREHWRDEQRLLELDARLASGGTRSLDDDADSRAVAAALAPRIAGALAALNREQRDVLLLHAWADLSHEEISVGVHSSFDPKAGPGLDHGVLLKPSRRCCGPECLPRRSSLPAGTPRGSRTSPTAASWCAGADDALR
ncbi:MAG TPA: RNA polymerase sigma factor [Trebonia sp.]